MERTFIVLYTHQKQKKAKTWHDGSLQHCGHGTRAVLYDERGSRLDSLHIRMEDIVLGEQVESDRYLIMVEELKPQTTTQPGCLQVTKPADNRSSIVGTNSLPSQPLMTRAKCAGLKRKKTGFRPPRVVKQAACDSQGEVLSDNQSSFNHQLNQSALHQIRNNLQQPSMLPRVTNVNNQSSGNLLAGQSGDLQDCTELVSRDRSYRNLIGMYSGGPVSSRESSNQGSHIGTSLSPWSVYGSAKSSPAASSPSLLKQTKNTTTKLEDTYTMKENPILQEETIVNTLPSVCRQSAKYIRGLQCDQQNDNPSAIQNDNPSANKPSLDHFRERLADDKTFQNAKHCAQNVVLTCNVKSNINAGIDRLQSCSNSSQTAPVSSTELLGQQNRKLSQIMNLLRKKPLKDSTESHQNFNENLCSFNQDNHVYNQNKKFDAELSKIGSNSSDTAENKPTENGSNLISGSNGMERKEIEIKSCSNGDDVLKANCASPENKSQENEHLQSPALFSYLFKENSILTFNSKLLKVADEPTSKQQTNNIENSVNMFTGSTSTDINKAEYSQDLIEGYSLKCRENSRGNATCSANMVNNSLQKNQNEQINCVVQTRISLSRHDTNDNNETTLNHHETDTAKSQINILLKDSDEINDAVKSEVEEDDDIFAGSFAISYSPLAQGEENSSDVGFEFSESQDIESVLNKECQIEVFDVKKSEGNGASLEAENGVKSIGISCEDRANVSGEIDVDEDGADFIAVSNAGKDKTNDIDISDADKDRVEGNGVCDVGKKSYSDDEQIKVSLYEKPHDVLDTESRARHLQSETDTNKPRQADEEVQSTNGEKIDYGPSIRKDAKDATLLKTGKALHDISKELNFPGFNESEEISKCQLSHQILTKDDSLEIVENKPEKPEVKRDILTKPVSDGIQGHNPEVEYQHSQFLAGNNISQYSDRSRTQESQDTMELSLNTLDEDNGQSWAEDGICNDQFTASPISRIHQLKAASDSENNVFKQSVMSTEEKICPNDEVLLKRPLDSQLDFKKAKVHQRIFDNRKKSSIQTNDMLTELEDDFHQKDISMKIQNTNYVGNSEEPTCDWFENSEETVEKQSTKIALDSINKPHQLLRPMIDSAVSSSYQLDTNTGQAEGFSHQYVDMDCQDSKNMYPPEGQPNISVSPPPHPSQLFSKAKKYRQANTTDMADAAGSVMDRSLPLSDQTKSCLTNTWMHRKSSRVVSRQTFQVSNDTASPLCCIGDSPQVRYMNWDDSTPSPAGIEAMDQTSAGFSHGMTYADRLCVSHCTSPTPVLDSTVISEIANPSPPLVKPCFEILSDDDIYSQVYGRGFMFQSNDQTACRAMPSPQSQVKPLLLPNNKNVEKDSNSPETSAYEKHIYPAFEDRMESFWKSKYTVSNANKARVGEDASDCDSSCIPQERGLQLLYNASLGAESVSIVGSFSPSHSDPRERQFQHSESSEEFFIPARKTVLRKTSDTSSELPKNENERSQKTDLPTFQKNQSKQYIGDNVEKPCLSKWGKYMPSDTSDDGLDLTEFVDTSKAKNQMFTVINKPAIKLEVFQNRHEKLKTVVKTRQYTQNENQVMQEIDDSDDDHSNTPECSQGTNVTNGLNDPAVGLDQRAECQPDSHPEVSGTVSEVNVNHKLQEIKNRHDQAVPGSFPSTDSFDELFDSDSFQLEELDFCKNSIDTHDGQFVAFNREKDNDDSIIQVDEVTQDFAENSSKHFIEDSKKAIDYDTESVENQVGPNNSANAEKLQELYLSETNSRGKCTSERHDINMLIKGMDKNVLFDEREHCKQESQGESLESCRPKSRDPLIENCKPKSQDHLIENCDPKSQHDAKQSCKPKCEDGDIENVSPESKDSLNSDNPENEIFNISLDDTLEISFENRDVLSDNSNKAASPASRPSLRIGWQPSVRPFGDKTSENRTQGQKKNSSTAITKLQPVSNKCMDLISKLKKGVTEYKNDQFNNTLTKESSETAKENELAKEIANSGTCVTKSSSHNSSYKNPSLLKGRQLYSHPVASQRHHQQASVQESTVDIMTGMVAGSGSSITNRIDGGSGSSASTWDLSNDRQESNRLPLGSQTTKSNKRFKPPIMKSQLKARGQLDPRGMQLISRKSPNFSKLSGATKGVVPCDRLYFPSQSDVDVSPSILRQVLIPFSFSSATAYKQVLSQAVVEYMNTQLFDVAKRYYQALSKVNVSGLDHTGGERAKTGTSSPSPLCQCGLPSKVISVRKEGPNQGKLFYTCSASRKQQCKFFQWVDEKKRGVASENGDSRRMIEGSHCLNLFLKDQRVYLHSQSAFIKRTKETFKNKYKAPKWLRQNDGESQQKKQLFLRLSYKGPSSLYSKDDVWVISSQLTFPAGQTFLARSVFYGPNSACEVEIEPLEGFSPSNWGHECMCHALLVGNMAAELSCLDNIRDHVNSQYLPLLPHLIQRLDSDQPSRDMKFQPPRQQDPSPTHNLQQSVDREQMDELRVRYVEDYSLNPDQAEALRRLAAMFTAGKSHHVDSILLIHGVFGAGKSYLLSVMVLFLMEVFQIMASRAETGVIPWKLLISSTTNVAVDRILMGLLDLGFTEFIRVGSVKKIAKPILPFSVHAVGTDSQELKDLQTMLRSDDLSPSEKSFVRQSIEKHRLGENKKKLKAVQVVGVTCASCSLPCLNNMTFPLVLLDECSQMTEPASLLPVARFGCQKLILVGDPNQLDPTIPGMEAAHAHGLEQTLFDRLSNMGCIPTILRTQYRCHPSISRVANKLFYGGMLIDGITEHDRQPLLILLPTLCYYDVDRGQECCEGFSSYYNMREAQFVVFLIQVLLASGLEPQTLGVITLYRSQMTLITDLMSGQSGHGEMKGVQVSTVDAFQGGERDVIILSCVRTEACGFIDNAKRTNVAVTRARHHLLIVGNLRNMSQNHLWGNIITQCRELPNGVQSADEARHNLEQYIETLKKKGTSQCSEENQGNSGETRTSQSKSGSQGRRRQPSGGIGPGASPPASTEGVKKSEKNKGQRKKANKRKFSGDADLSVLISDEELSSSSYTTAVDKKSQRKRGKKRQLSGDIDLPASVSDGDFSTPSSGPRNKILATKTTIGCEKTNKKLKQFKKTTVGVSSPGISASFDGTEEDGDVTIVPQEYSWDGSSPPMSLTPLDEWKVMH